MTATVQDQIFEIIEEYAQIDAASIRLDSTIRDLGIASLDTIEILFDIEEHFDITLPELDPEFETDNVQRLIAIVTQAVDSNAQSSVATKH
ncbi:MAG: phosphopantetheine-binding protein [Salinisphaera sp.]|jgi:acyl carrier protein|nr:phosphopantetheine-binding protein [Salinisphaera sp.]